MHLLQVDSKHAAGQRDPINNHMIFTFGFDEGNLVDDFGFGNGLSISENALKPCSGRAALFYPERFHEGIQIGVEWNVV